MKLKVFKFLSSTVPPPPEWINVNAADQQGLYITHPQGLSNNTALNLLQALKEVKCVGFQTVSYHLRRVATVEVNKKTKVRF